MNLLYERVIIPSANKYLLLLSNFVHRAAFFIIQKLKVLCYQDPHPKAS